MLAGLGVGERALQQLPDVVAPGEDARVDDTSLAPRFGARDVVSVPRGKVYQTLTWNTPGTYHLTCTLHPEMNLTVVVAP